jgi:autotransporter-associated beta strand protein
LSAGYEYIGFIGAGNFTQSGGTNNIPTALYLGYTSSASGTYNLNGGTLILPALSDGPGTAAFNFGGGTLQASGPFSTAMPMTLTGSGGNATVDTAGYAVTLSGSLSGPGGLVKTDSGTLVLAASNTYTGGTLVEAGILVVSNGSSGSATGSGNVTLSGGTLASGAGGGTITGEVEIGSVASEIAPGGIGSIGQLTIGNLLTASNLATLNFDLTTPGGSGDLLVVTGNLTLAPNTAITFGTPPVVPGDYRLIGYGSLTGSLSDFDLPGAPPNTMYALSTTVDPRYIDLVVAVPEPSTFALLGIGVIGLMGWAWRRRKRAA